MCCLPSGLRLRHALRLKRRLQPWLPALGTEPQLQPPVMAVRIAIASYRASMRPWRLMWKWMRAWVMVVQWMTLAMTNGVAVVAMMRRLGHPLLLQLLLLHHRQQSVPICSVVQPLARPQTTRSMAQRKKAACSGPHGPLQQAGPQRLAPWQYQYPPSLKYGRRWMLGPSGQPSWRMWPPSSHCQWG